MLLRANLTVLLVSSAIAGCGGAHVDTAPRVEASPTRAPAETHAGASSEVRVVYAIEGETVDRETFEALFSLLDVQDEPSVSGNLSGPMDEFGGSFANYPASRRDTGETYTYTLTNQVHPSGSRNTHREITRQGL
jgi:hypothetical protein